MEARSWLETLEGRADEEVLAGLAFLAAQDVRLDADDLRAARRRALLLLASAGDPRRDLDPAGRAVGSLVADLDAAERRDELAAALAQLRAQAHGLPLVASALDRLLADGDLAWRWLACSLLAEELAE